MPQRLLARRPDPTTSALGTTGRTTTRLPTELADEQVKRLSAFTTVGFAVWTFALLLDVVLLPVLSEGWVRNDRLIALEVTGAIGSAAMCWYLRRSTSSIEGKQLAGLGAMLLNAGLIAATNAWALPAPTARPEDIGRPSWIALVIVIFAMIAPTSPRRLLAASLVAASLDPLAYVLMTLLGEPAPDAVQVFVLSWPAFACAFIAVVPAKVMHHLGRRLREAQELGSYSLVERLGQGGMGEVWRAEHRLLARDAAIKLVRPEVLGARDAAEANAVLRRFEREAQATAALGSPHSIHVFDFGITEEGTFYYVMELLEGRDLESLVREFGPLSADRVIFLLRQVCHSLADAHARGLVHRDIKPANIYVCRMGLDYDFVKVLDFGLVKFRDRPAGADSLATLDKVTTGTPAYMAPETILGEGEVDRRADVYALGCVAYYALTGSLVFEADSSMKMLIRHLHDQPARPSERSELPIPRELDDLVMACLEKDPARRPQNAGDLLAMAYSCQCAEGWNQVQAENWWKAHLPHLTGSLTAAPRRDKAAAVVSV